jgi:hypothetical protein
MPSNIQGIQSSQISNNPSIQQQPQTSQFQQQQQIPNFGQPNPQQQQQQMQMPGNQLGTHPSQLFY